MTASIAAFQGIGQKPLNMLGPHAPHSFAMAHEAYFAGATGTVATAGGTPFMTLTKTQRTGIYDLKFPATRSVFLMAGLRAPTGFYGHAEIKNESGVSGTGEVHIFRHTAITQASGTPPTGTAQLVNPPTGTVLKIMGFGFPSVPDGIMRF